MSRHAVTATAVEMLKARVTVTDTGFPAPLAAVQEIFGPRVNPAPEDAWFWIGATPRSAARIRRDGHKTVGQGYTTWIPPQEPPVIHDADEPEGDYRPRYVEGDVIAGP